MFQVKVIKNMTYFINLFIILLDFFPIEYVIEECINKF